MAVGIAGAPQAGKAATITAQSCSSSAVQSAVNSAVSGDTVIVPIGSCRWTSGVTIDNKAIHLRGQTAESVIITHDAKSHALVLIESSAGPIRVSHLVFRGGTGQAHTIRMLRAIRNGRAMLIHNNRWVGAVSAIRAETNRGVIYSNIMNAHGLDQSFVQCKAEGLGLPSWTSHSTMGNADAAGESNLYVESNTVIAVPLQAFDSDGNCRIVVRHNVFHDSGYTSHGPDTGPYGNRHTELYNNTFSFTDTGCGQPASSMDYFIFVRGGAWVIADNVIPDLKSCWMGDKAEIKFQIQNLRRNSGPMPCWSGAYPMPRQVGLGHNGRSYVSDPVYIWGNTGGGAVGPTVENYSPDECGGGADISTFVKIGRDYLLSPKPDYAKFRYPHPLRGPSVRADNPPSPPTSLRVVPPAANQ